MKSNTTKIQKYSHGLQDWVHKVRLLKGRAKGLSVKKITELDSLDFEWKLEGETLNNIQGLISEPLFVEKSGLSNIRKYRKQGLIKPIGYALSGPSVCAFYHPRQISELKKKLGITLDNTNGLLSERSFRKEAGLDGIHVYRKKGLIKPIGFGITSTGVRPFYHPKQIKELKKKLGITLENINGLMTETEFMRAYKLNVLREYRKKGFIRPVGYSITNAGIRPYYHPKQIYALRKRLGITLKSTNGLINETEFARISGFTRIANYRKQGLIKPIGYAIASGAGVKPFYHPKQIKELKRKLGITLHNTRGLLNEKQFRKVSGLENITKYRQRGLIKPIGYAITTGVRPFYHPKQIGELKKKLGITLENIDGLLTESQFRKAIGFNPIRRFREKGLIKPVGFAIHNSGLCTFYHPKQIKSLKKKLGITLDNVEGLLNEEQVIRCYKLTNIREYRRRGLIRPFGYAYSIGGVIGYYKPEQINKLKVKLKGKR